MVILLLLLFHNQPLPRNLSRPQPLLSLLLLKLSVHVSYFVPDFVFVAWHPFEVGNGLVHLFSKSDVLLQQLPAALSLIVVTLVVAVVTSG